MKDVSRRRLLQRTGATIALTSLPLAIRAQTIRPAASDTEWRSYANDLAYTRYSPLDQINAANFGKLQVA